MAGVSAADSAGCDDRHNDIPDEAAAGGPKSRRTSAPGGHFDRALEPKRYFRPMHDGLAVEEVDHARLDWCRKRMGDQSGCDDGIAPVVKCNRESSIL